MAHVVGVTVYPQLTDKIVMGGTPFVFNRSSKLKGTASFNVTVPTTAKYKTFEWENEVIDNMLDLLTGTDLKAVASFDY